MELAMRFKLLAAKWMIVLTVISAFAHCRPGETWIANEISTCNRMRDFYPQIQRYRFVIPAKAEALHNSEAGQSSVFHALHVTGPQFSLG